MKNIILIGFLLIVGSSFSQLTETVSDSRDGSVYKTVIIGNQTWMAEDIQVIKYNNGDPIFQAKSEEDWSNFGKTQKGCFYELNNGIILYNGYALNDPRGILPAGYRLPSYSDFAKLFEYLGGGGSQDGTSTLSLATYPIYIEEWVGDQETGGLDMVEVQTNGESGFNAVMGGFIYDNGLGSMGLSAEASNCSYWWTSSFENGQRIGVDIGYCSQDAGGGKANYPSAFGLAIRAIKN
jgi:uncharacterized protein (TIGR02145 family)